MTAPVTRLRAVRPLRRERLRRMRSAQRRESNCPAAVPPQTDDVEFTIERPRGDQDDVIDVEQLNLF